MSLAMTSFPIKTLRNLHSRKLPLMRLKHVLFVSRSNSDFLNVIEFLSFLQSDHEYESAAEDSAQEESEVLDLPTDDEKNHKAAVDQDAEDGDNEEDDDRDDDDDPDDVSDPDNVLTEEREAGDGQEENKKVDDDEDRRNPQYIPKKGMFYEHDSRMDSEEEAAAAEAAKVDPAKPARVPRSENVERWGHDKFLEREQQPKTREELVQSYGYDIRNEDSAPRARRRRRYGRGPNKYERKWEDEEAYEPRNGPKSERGGTKSGRGGRVDKREFRDSNELSSETARAPRMKSDLEEFPPLEHKNNKTNSSSGSKQTDISSNSKSLRGGSNNASSSSRGRGGRGGGSSRGRGAGNGPSGGDRPQTQSSSIDSKKQRASGGKSEYSANQRLQKEPKPVVQNAHPNRSQESGGGKMDRLEKDFNSKAKLDDKKRGAKDSPRTSRRGAQDSEDNSKPKRYSNSRRGGGGNSRQHQQDYYDYNDQQQDSPQQQPSRYMNGNGPNSSAVSNVPPSNFVNNFPNSGSGPPPAAPFIAANTVATPPTSTSGFQDPAMIVNYGPPVQFVQQPVAVPVTVTVPLVSVPGGVAGTPQDSLAVLHPPLGTPTVTSPDQVLLAAAAAAQAQGAGQGYAEVRGGVTYFNPTAQAPVMARPVNKRPKAAIPIVDPSQVGAVSPGSSLVASDSLEESLEAPSSVMVAKT